jgi:hypothetical protein
MLYLLVIGAAPGLNFSSPIHRRDNTPSSLIFKILLFQLILIISIHSHIPSMRKYIICGTSRLKTAEMTAGMTGEDRLDWLVAWDYGSTSIAKGLNV